MFWQRRHQHAIAGLAALLLVAGALRWWQRPAEMPAAGSAVANAGGEGVAVKLDPNVATEAELSVVPGIGRSRAKEIVRARAEGKLFRSLKDLDDVKRFGASSLEQAGPFLSFPDRDNPASDSVLQGVGGEENGLAGQR